MLVLREPCLEDEKSIEDILEYNKINYYRINHEVQMKKFKEVILWIF